MDGSENSSSFGVGAVGGMMWAFLASAMMLATTSSSLERATRLAVAGLGSGGGAPRKGDLVVFVGD